jgi:transposase-like protein
MECPKCGSTNIVKNGSIHNGKKKYACKDCNRQFVNNPKNKVISQETKELIDKLLVERISLAAIARVSGVSEQWLHDYLNNKLKKKSPPADLPARRNTRTSTTA